MEPRHLNIEHCPLKQCNAPTLYNGLHGSALIVLPHHFQLAASSFVAPVVFSELLRLYTLYLI